MITQATGDPLQVALLIHFVLALGLLNAGSSPVLAALAYLVFGVASVLVHEAAVFFIAPALILPVTRRNLSADRAALCGYLAGAIPALYLTIHVAQSVAPAIAPMHLHSIPMPTDASFQLGPLSSVLAKENAEHFHSGLRGYVLLARNGVGAVALPLLLGSVLAHLLSRSLGANFGSRRRGILAFALPLLLSAPLWVTAHDWGRFSSYLFLLSVFVLSRELFPANVPDAQSDQLPAFALAALLVLSGITTSAALGDYLIKGLGANNPTLLAAVFLCCVIGYCVSRDSTRPRFYSS
jgi:hypothetical protein